MGQAINDKCVNIKYVSRKLQTTVKLTTMRRPCALTSKTAANQEKSFWWKISLKSERVTFLGQVIIRSKPLFHFEFSLKVSIFLELPTFFCMLLQQVWVSLSEIKSVVSKGPFFFFCVLSYISGVHHFVCDFLVWPFSNHIEVVTFHLCG